MKCSRCKQKFEETDLQESHDVPCYLFIGMNRRISKQHADKFSRRWLCESCHKKYEESLNIILIAEALEFSKKYFKDGEKNDSV